VMKNSTWATRKLAQLEKENSFLRSELDERDAKIADLQDKMFRYSCTHRLMLETQDALFARNRALSEQLAASAAVSKWISVEDAMPERNMAAPDGENHVSSPVLTFGKIRGILPEYNVAVFNHPDQVWELEVYFDFKPHEPCAEVTHWMELPKEAV